MTKIPFAVYDFFGYLAAGFLLLVGTDHIAQQGWVSEANRGAVGGLLWVTAAYIIGQLVAGPSAWLLERNIVGKLLKRPNANLFRDPPPRWWSVLAAQAGSRSPVGVSKAFLHSSKREECPKECRVCGLPSTYAFSA